MSATDSAGVPWAGRSFEENSNAADDGSAPEQLVRAIQQFQERQAGEAAVVDALRECRLLIPLVAELGEEGIGEGGLRVDKSQELSIVTVAGPDGRTVLPAFSSVAAMNAWNPMARPVPAPASRVALAAAAEQTDLVVLDPTSAMEFVLRRPALRAIGLSEPWTPCYLDEDVLAAFVESAVPERAVLAVQLAPGDPTARLAGPELVVHLSLTAGLDRSQLDGMLARLQARWAESVLIAGRVDSIRVELDTAS